MTPAPLESLRMEWLHMILGPDIKAGLLIVATIIIIEGVLSVDNAAVLAQMVMGLPEDQRGKALRIGLIFGYVLRGICILLVGVLVKVWWIGPVGGAYLLMLAVKHFAKKEHVEEEAEEAVDMQGHWLYNHAVRLMGPFWATVASVEVMDLMFSIDNVIAANAIAPGNYTLIIFGVFVGILFMRFAAQGFVVLMHRYPFLETCAFLVVGLLGLKLLAEVGVHFWPASGFAHVLESMTFKVVWSVTTLGIFFIPVLTHQLLGWPRKK